MRIYFEQIPAGADAGDYPPDTIFIFYEHPRKRDPVTFQLIRPPKKKLIYPEDCKPQCEEAEHMKTVQAVLDGYLHELNQYQEYLLRKDNGTNTEDILFLYRYLEETRTLVEDAQDVYKALRVYRLRLAEDRVLSMLEKYGIYLDV
jgi:hypothetical protein